MEKKKVTVKPATKEEAPAKEKKVINCYHVTQNADKTAWEVKLANGAKAIKLFRTQKEAQDYAKELGEKNDRGFVLHSKKGKIRKA